MSLQYVDYSSVVDPPQVIFAKGPGNQHTIGEGGGRPLKAAKKPAKKAKKGGKK
jgi:hypothetical protein